MDGGIATEITGILAFLLAILILHELAHVAVARLHGYPVICLAVSPLAIGVVFLDQPGKRYWILQVLVPMVVTTAVVFMGLRVVPVVAPAARLVFGEGILWQLAFCFLFSALTSSGDVACMGMELRRPAWGKNRVVRDVKLLKRMGSLIWFTDFGRRYLLAEFGLPPREFIIAVDQRGTAKAASRSG